MLTVLSCIQNPYVYCPTNCVTLVCVAALVSCAAAFPFTAWTDANGHAGAELATARSWDLPFSLPFPSGPLDASFFPPANGQTIGSVTHGDVNWDTVNVADAYVEVSVVGASAVQAGIGGIAVSTQPTPFTIAHSFLGFTLTCSGTLSVAVPRAGVFFTVDGTNVTSGVNVTLRLDGIATTLAFNRGVCGFAAGLFPQLTSTVESAVVRALSLPSVRQAVSDGVAGLVRTLNNTNATAVIADTLAQLLNTTAAHTLLPTALLDSAAQIVADFGDGNITAAAVTIQQATSSTIRDWAAQTAAALAGNGSDALQIIGAIFPGVDVDTLLHDVMTSIDQAMEPTMEAAGGSFQAALSAWSNITDMWQSLATVDRLIALATLPQVSAAVVEYFLGVIMAVESIAPGIDFDASRLALVDVEPLTLASLQTFATVVLKDLDAWVTKLEPSAVPPIVAEVSMWANIYAFNITRIVDEAAASLPALLDLVNDTLSASTSGEVTWNTSEWKAADCIVHAMQTGPKRIALRSVEASVPTIAITAGVSADSLLSFTVRLRDSLAGSFAFQQVVDPAAGGVASVCATLNIVESYALSGPAPTESGVFPLKACASVTELSLRVGSGSSTLAAGATVQLPRDVLTTIRYLHNAATDVVESCLTGSSSHSDDSEMPKPPPTTTR